MVADESIPSPGTPPDCTPGQALGTAGSTNSRRMEVERAVCSLTLVCNLMLSSPTADELRSTSWAGDRCIMVLDVVFCFSDTDPGRVVGGPVSAPGC